MKNYEKYADEIKKYKVSKCGCFCNEFVMPNILKSEDCGGLDCVACFMLQTIWLLENYEEPEVDCSKIKIDTPILVRDFEDAKWAKRHFAKYEDGKVYAWSNGVTSWTTEGHGVMWNYAKLAESEE